MLQQEQQRLVHRLRVDQVVVVQNQDPLFVCGPGGQFVDQRRHQACERRRWGSAEQRQRPGPATKGSTGQVHLRLTPGRGVRSYRTE
jgi:hypothetical protein